MKQKRPVSIYSVLEVLGKAVIFGFFIFSSFIGGTAGLGYTDGVNYFVCNHGDYTQVSEMMWIISFVFEIIFWLNIPGTVVCYFLKNRESNNKNEHI